NAPSGFLCTGRCHIRCAPAQKILHTRMAFSPGPPATLRPRSRWSPTSESAREPLLEVGEQLFTRVLAACSEIADARPFEIDRARVLIVECSERRLIPFPDEHRASRGRRDFQTDGLSRAIE